MEALYKTYDEKMSKSLAQFVHELSTIRAGRANPAVLDKVHVDYYGSKTPVTQLASVAAVEARVLQITPWDVQALKGIEKAIQTSDIGINPSNDGKSIRLVFPQLTEERRKELIKTVHKYGEEAKVAMRNIRREAVDKYKDMKKKSEMTEDDLKVSEKEIQNLTDKYCADVDVAIKKKEKELLEV